MKSQPVITMALFSLWKEFMIFGTSYIAVNSVYRYFTRQTQIASDELWNYFNFLSLVMGGAVLIDNVSPVFNS